MTMFLIGMLCGVIVGGLAGWLGMGAAEQLRMKRVYREDREYAVRRRFEAGDPEIESTQTVGPYLDYSPPPSPEWIFYMGIPGSRSPEGILTYYRATWIRRKPSVRDESPPQ
jgi:hypothetical protein